MKDVFTADEVIGLLQRFDQEESDQPWLTVCSFLNPHDVSLAGIFLLAQHLHYETKEIPYVADAPTRNEDLSSKPTCQQSYAEAWGRLLAPQPFIQANMKLYYQMEREVDGNIERVLQALRASKQYENTIVIFFSDHGEMHGAHGGLHEKWHNGYEESIHVPFIVASPLIQAAPREVDVPTSHADLIPTLLGLAAIDPADALGKLAADHSEARPLVGRDLSPLILGAAAEAPSDPVLFMTDDEISEGSAKPASPFMKMAIGLGTFEVIKQPNHVETVVAEVDVDGEKHLVKFSRYHDNQQFWTIPGQVDKRLQKRKKFLTVTEPEPDEFELYDLTPDPFEQKNLAHPSNASDKSKKLQETMLGLLIEQLAAKRLVPSEGDVPGYRPPMAK
jgi:arylsulfatase A-like enzyme